MPCRMKRPKNIFVLLDYPVFWLNKNYVWIPAFAGMTGGSFNGQQIFHQVVIPAKAGIQYYKFQLYYINIF
ncbi:hypothetical protein TI05_09080 [Achromatium sp. WMS3]|nr:hypothetical protein TI05_09080 [Achromatium sp. WMS3]